MTVQEIIELLWKLPPNATVILPYREEPKSVMYDDTSNEVEIQVE